MCAAIVRTVRRGYPGTLFDHSSRGRFSMRYTVVRLLVCHAAINASASFVSFTIAPSGISFKNTFVVLIRGFGFSRCALCLRDFLETCSKGPLKSVRFLCASPCLRDSVVKNESCPTTESRRHRDAQRSRTIDSFQAVI